jgi:2-amino-4-hydroxy-6-hydroxymethyldihydropteridine diphosphokinase
MIHATAFIGLGANLGDSKQALRSAVVALRQLSESRLLDLSSLFRSAPLGPPDQNDYLNAVAKLETRLPPHALLQELQAIEDRHGRVRLQRWSARTLDLDLLLYGLDRISTSQLQVPHPEMHKRNFVLIPLLQLEPLLQLPDGISVAELPAAHDLAGLEELRPGPSWAD